MDIEMKLKKLFDYQRFEGNARLDQLIREAGDCRTEELSDEDISFVNAAGEIPEGSVPTDESITTPSGGGVYNYGPWDQGQQGEIRIRPEVKP